jgi:hypothetical protein
MANERITAKNSIGGMKRYLILSHTAALSNSCEILFSERYAKWIYNGKLTINNPF